MQQVLARVPMLPLGTPVMFKSKLTSISGRMYNPTLARPEYALADFPYSAWYLTANDMSVLWGDPVC